jgi:hypothetical protein
MLGDSYRNQFRFIKDGRAEMSDRVFYVGAQDKESNVTGYVPAKFLTLNGKPVVDPAPGGSQVGYIYADGSDKYKTRGEAANPNNYLIVPANYTEQHARAFAAEIANTVGLGPVGQALALHRMYNAFWPNGPQDLQTHPQWGIPENSFVPAFTGGASYHLGSVTRWAGLPEKVSEIGGGIPHWRSRPSVESEFPGLSQRNYKDISKGFADAGVARNGASPLMNDFGYNPQNQYPPGQIGDGNGLGVGDWRFAFAGVDPSNPLQPVPPPQTDSQPAPRLVRVNPSPAAGTTPGNPNLPNPSSGSGRPLGLFTGKPMPQWTVPPPLGGLPGNFNPPAGNSGDALSSSPQAPEKSQGPAVPYLLEYLQYLKQRDGG